MQKYENTTISKIMEEINIKYFNRVINVFLRGKLYNKLFNDSERFIRIDDAKELSQSLSRRIDVLKRIERELAENLSRILIGSSIALPLLTFTGMSLALSDGLPISTFALLTSPFSTLTSIYLTAPIDSIVNVVLSVSLWS